MNGSAATTRNRGLAWKQVRVQSIANGYATTMDDFGHLNKVRVGLARAKGLAPAVGERWIIDQDLGQWAFAAIIGYTAKAPVTVVSTGTPVVNTDITEIFIITDLAEDITSITLTGTPGPSTKLTFRIKDNGTAHSISWGPEFQALSVPLPTTTIPSIYLYVGFLYNEERGKWDCVAVAPSASASSAKTSASITSTATPAINTDFIDTFVITSLATNITSFTTNLTGAPTDHDRLLIRIKDNGVARSISWGASFAPMGVPLPFTTIVGKLLYVGLVYNAERGTWDCLAVANET